MALLTAILQNRQDVAVEGDLLRTQGQGEQNGGNQQQHHYLYYIRGCAKVL
jgi:hypothetical protein